MGFDTAPEYWGSLTETYDSLIRRVIPRYDEITQQLVDHLPASAARIAELGCGTGNLSLSLAAHFPNAELTFVDAAPEMLAVTRARLASAHPRAAARARFVEARFEDTGLPAASFDVITSQMSLHHVVAKGTLYRQLFELLLPDGAFWFTDRVRGATEASQDVSWQRWVAHCRRTCSEDEVKGLLEHADAHDHYTSLAEHFHLLEAAGFEGIDCAWRDWAWAIVSATRPTAGAA